MQCRGCREGSVLWWLEMKKDGLCYFGLQQGKPWILGYESHKRERVCACLYVCGVDT